MTGTPRAGRARSTRDRPPRRPPPPQTAHRDRDGQRNGMVEPKPSGCLAMRAFLISLCALRARCDLTIHAAPRGALERTRRMSVTIGSDGEDCGSAPSVRAPDGHRGMRVSMRVCGLSGCRLDDATLVFHA